MMIKIDHYSDVLCVWAYVAQARVDELQSQFAEQISLRWHYLPVFGNARQKLTGQWAGRGGIESYAGHVRDVASGFDHVEMGTEAWTSVVPHSSAQAHLWLCAARLAGAAGTVAEDAEITLAWAFRVGFFRDGRDVGQHAVLRTIVAEQDLSPNVLEQHIEDGSAHAALCDDMQIARDNNVRSSPTLIFNEDRQRLTGNVGYRIIEANVRELLEQPHSQHSWC